MKKIKIWSKLKKTALMSRIRKNYIISAKTHWPKEESIYNIDYYEKKKKWNLTDTAGKD